MKHYLKPTVVLGLAAMALSLLGLTAGQTSLKLVTPTPAGREPGLKLRLQLQSTSNEVIYVVQSSTNLVSWQTLLSGKSKPGAVVNVTDVTPTNTAVFFRIREYGGEITDTNAPVWTNGVKGQLTVNPPASASVTWNAAVDDLGVAEYRLYLNGVVVTNLVASILTYEFTVDWHQRTDLRIQALDASGNASDIFSLAYLPGDAILAVSDESGRIYTAYLQTNGLFSGLQRIADLNSGAWGVGMADFDRDGILDLIGGGASGNRLTPFFFKGKGDGTFAAPVALSPVDGANGYMMGATVGDLDGDGNLDFACNGNERYVFFYWGNGDGTFNLTVRDWGCCGRGLVAGDFNEDGRLDLVRGTYSDGRVRLFLSNGDRTFTEMAVVGQFGDAPYGLTGGDFDEDGHLDLIQNRGGNGDVVFYKGFGDGAFTSVGTNGAWANLDPDDYAAFANFDYDGDGHLDLVQAIYGAHAVYYYPGNGDGTFSTNRQYLGNNIGRALGITGPLAPPRVDVGIVPLDPVTNLNGTLTFTGVGTGLGTNDVFQWTFGDDTTNLFAWTFPTNGADMGRQVSHTYTNEGRFITRLLHRSDTGVMSLRGTWATIKGRAPEANPGGPYVFDETTARQAIWTGTLSGAASTDDFGVVQYIWNFGDGSSVTNATPSVTHAWTGIGPWTVTLTVVDAARQTSTASTTVTFVPGQPPVAAIVGPDVVDETAARNGVWTANFHGDNSTDDVGIWKYDWNFGNGRTGTGSRVQTTYTAVGTYTVSLTVTDHATQTNTVTHEVTIKANGLPVPVIDGPRLLTVQAATNGLWFGAWSGAGSTDDVGIYQYNWEFGDGATASGAQVTHNYGAQGVYPLKLRVTDHGNQSVTATQNVIVVAGNPPVARITASTLKPEGAQPISFSGATSTSDNGIFLYRWFLPPRSFDFAGQYLDPGQWQSANAVQNGQLTVTGRGNWGNSYFFSGSTLFQRGGTLQCRVDTPSGGAHCMVGVKNLNLGSASYSQYPYAIYFNNGEVRIYANGGDRGRATNYSAGTAYDLRIETKPGAGARFYMRPSGTDGEFALIRETDEISDSVFSFGADVHTGVFAFRNFEVSNVVSQSRDFVAPIYPGGPVTLQVVDAALLTNATSVVVTPVVGAAPTAFINGPTNGQTGIELSFDAYGSADDYAIATYTWDFGDGSPVAFGPVANHAYGAPGTYTNTVTVRDYANQSASASLIVTVTGGNALVCVPWLIVNGVIQPHETYEGKTNTLKAVARGLSVPFTNIWDFGDGTGSVTNVITAADPNGIYNLEALHAYTGAPGVPYYAVATVITTNGTVHRDTYPLLMRPKTLDVEMKVAIDEGLWWVHKAQRRYDFDVHTKGGDWYANGYRINATASAVQALAINGHLVTDDAARDPYVDTVRRGVAYLLNATATWNIGPQTYGDPDSNGNGIGLGADSGRSIYESGPVMDALVAACRPELVAWTGAPNVKGRTIKEIVQDMADQYAWGQYDGEAGGGWRYGWQEFPDNSASQWGAIGLYAAEHFWGVKVPEWVKQRNLIWVQYSKGGSGYGYTGPGDGPALTPSGLVQLAYDGVSVTNSYWQHGENYLARNWASIMSQNNVYANYAIAKALRTAVPQPVHNLAENGKDWFLDSVNGLARVTINRQYPDGHWIDNAWVEPQIATPWSIIILSSSLFQQGPVAVITVSPNPSAVGYPVVFDARGSYHRHPSYKVVEYRWVFDSSKGLDFDHPDAIGPVVTNVFGQFSTNNVSLQVRDNGTPQLLDVASVVTTTTVPPYPPTADAGGPYVALVGQDIELDASGSFCVDAAAGNFIRAYDWQVIWRVPLTFDQGVTGERAIITNGYPAAGAYQIALRVKNANSLVYTNFSLPDMTADAFTTVYVYDKAIGDLKVRPKGNKIQLVWTKVGDYAVVARSEINGQRGFKEIGRTASTYATFLDTDVEYNKEYFYRVYAYVNGRPDPIGASDPVLIVSPPRGLDQNPPRFQSSPDRFARVGEPYRPVLQAVDLENKPMLFSLLEGPTNMTVHPASGQVDFVPTSEQVGNHPLSFQVTNSAGRDVISLTLFVMPASNGAPTVAINGPYAALTGEAIQFSSAGSSDPDNNTLRYVWNFGDGQTSTDANPVHTYGGIGEYLVSLFVNDGYGGTASAQTHATITRPNRAPVITLAKGPSFTVRLGEALQLDASGSYDLDGNPIAFVWNWGDGTTNSGTVPAQAHTYAALGDYAGSLTGTDGQGGVGTYDFQVTVAPANQPPVITLGVSTNEPIVTTSVTFDATASTDPEGDPLTFEWDFGDRARTTGSIVTHAYRQMGDFTVTLKVKDNRGGETQTTYALRAVNAPPVFTSNPPLLARAGTNYTYTPALSDLDGDASTFQLAQGPAAMTCDTNTGTLAWLPGTNDVGPNAIVLRATDANGGVTDQSFTLVVTTPLGPQLDLAPTHIAMTNVVVDGQSLAMSGTVRVYLRNAGSDEVPVPFTVSVFVDRNLDGNYSTNSDTLAGYGVMPAGMPANGLGWVEMNVQGEALFKDAPLSAFVDSENVAPEYDEFNNIRRAGFDAGTNQPPVVDLSASRLEVDRTGLPTRAVLTARLGNSGLTIMPAEVPMAFYDGEPQNGGTLIGVARTTQKLLPGAFEDLSLAWDGPAITNHTVYVIADQDGNGTNLLAEINLSNNVLTVEIDLAEVLPPVADAGPEQTVAVGDTVVLNGRGSSDPQGKALAYRWSLLSLPVGSRTRVTGNTTATPSFLADVAGPYRLQLVVNNGRLDSTNTSIVKITAVDTNAVYPPSITSVPSFQGMVGIPYTYPVLATDPQGQPLTYRLPQGPAGMTIQTNTGLVSWTPATNGTFLVRVEADGVGGSAYQSYSLTVVTYTNYPPRFTSAPGLTAMPGAAYTYTATAIDQNLDTLAYALTQKPAGMAINAQSGAITWTPAPAQIGGNAVTVTATDGKGGTATQSFNLVVMNPGVTVLPIPDQMVTAPASFATISLDAYVRDPQYAPSDMVWTVTGAKLYTVSIDSNRVATITYPAGTLTSETLTFLATNPDGKSGYAAPVFTVRGVNNPPVAALANLSAENTTTVESGFFDLRGTANDPDSIDPVAYRVRLYDPTGTLVADVTPGPLNTAGWHEGRVAPGGALGTLDFSTVRNGSYTLMLQVRGGDQTASAVAQIALASQLAIGQLKFSQHDMVLRLGGVALQVSRTYDSQNTSVGDFGHSWTYSVSDLGLTVDETRAITYDLFDGEPFSLRTGGSWDVTLDMPDTGRRVTFTFSMQFGGMFKHRATWTPPAGIHATLVPTVSPVLITLPGGLPPFWEVAGIETDWQAFDWPGFILTTADGTQYRVDRNNEGFHYYISDTGLGGYVQAYSGAFLTRITQPNGNRTEFVHQGSSLKSIDAYDAANQKLNSFLMKRDGQDRIQAIYTPQNLDTNGVPVGPASMTYEYDSTGNLSKANRLIDSRNPTNLVYATTTYVYGNPRFPHFITEVRDPMNVPTMRTEFDERGRLVALVDAQGNRTRFEHNPGARTDTAFDRMGNPTLHVYDEQGRVVMQVDALGGVTRRAFDASGNMTMEIDPIGNTNLFTYDSSGRELTATDALGNVTKRSYDSKGNLLTATDALGQVTSFDYDQGGNLSKIIDPDGNVLGRTYDAANRMISSTDAAGNKTRFEYDSRGNLIRQVDPLGNETTFGYDAAGNQTSQTTVITLLSGAKRTNTVVTAYDAAGRAISVTDASGNTTLTEYNALDQPIATIDPLGHRTEMEYDERGNLTRTRYPDGTTWATAYDENGRKVAETDRQNRTTYYQYDVLGRLVTTIFPDDTRTSSEYDVGGRVIATVDARGNRTTYGYDALGREIAKTNAVGAVTRTTYDAAGRPTAQTDALGRTTFFFYNKQGRPVRTIYPDGTSKRTAYDVVGRVVESVDEAGATMRYQYDPAGRLTNVVDSLGQQTSYAYNEEGKLIRQRDANGRDTSYDVETCCQISSTILPMGQRMTAVYAGGLLTAVTNYNGQVVRYEYDVNNRLAAKRFPDGSAVLFAWSPMGKLQTAVDARGVTQFEYDLQDRLTRQIGPDGKVIAYAYDAAGNRTSITSSNPQAPDARVTSYSFDPVNRLATVADPQGGLTRHTYDAVDNVVQIEFPNGTFQTNLFDQLNRPTYIEHRSPTNLISSFLYTVGPAGNRLSVREHTGRLVRYDYDALYRVIREAVVSDPGGLDFTNEYAYDAVGNRTSWVLRSAALNEARNYEYDANDQLLTESNQVSKLITRFNYDANGNTLSRSNALEAAFYTWNGDDRLAGATITDTNGVTRYLRYEYDHNGIRVAAHIVESGQTNSTSYLVDGNQGFAQVLEEWESLNGQPGALGAAYTYGSQLLSQSRGGTSSYYHPDALGSTRALSGPGGDPTDRYDYDAYGRALRMSGSTANPYLFAGQQRDSRLGLDYLRDRYLNVESGRFYGRDRVPGRLNQPLSLNRFAYVSGNPVNRIDPTGQFDFSLAGVMVAQNISQIVNVAINTYNVVRAFCTAKTTLEAVNTAWMLGSAVYIYYELSDYINAALGHRVTGRLPSITRWWDIKPILPASFAVLKKIEFRVQLSGGPPITGSLGIAINIGPVESRTSYNLVTGRWQQQLGGEVKLPPIKVCGITVAEMAFKYRPISVHSQPEPGDVGIGFRLGIEAKIAGNKIITVPIIGSDIF